MPEVCGFDWWCVKVERAYDHFINNLKLGTIFCLAAWLAELSGDFGLRQFDVAGLVWPSEKFRSGKDAWTTTINVKLDRSISALKCSALQVVTYRSLHLPIGISPLVVPKRGQSYWSTVQKTRNHFRVSLAGRPRNVHHIGLSGTSGNLNGWHSQIEQKPLLRIMPLPSCQLNRFNVQTTPKNSNILADIFSLAPNLSLFFHWRETSWCYSNKLNVFHWSPPGVQRYWLMYDILYISSRPQAKFLIVERLSVEMEKWFVRLHVNVRFHFYATPDQMHNGHSHNWNSSKTNYQ